MAPLLIVVDLGLCDTGCVNGEVIGPENLGVRLQILFLLENAKMGSGHMDAAIQKTGVWVDSACWL